MHTNHIKVLENYEEDSEGGFQIIRCDLIKRIYGESYDQKGTSEILKYYAICIDCGDDLVIRSEGYPDIHTMYKEIEKLYEQLQKKK